MDSEIENRPIVLVTGSAGLIGSRVVEALSTQYNVVGLDVKEPKQKAAQSAFVECDLTKDKSVADAFDTIRKRYGSTLASVIHLAAYYDFSGQPSDMYQKLTVEGTSRLLKKLQEFQTEQFVFSSSLLVMEEAEEGETITESSPLEDEPWDYPRSKIEAEKVIRQERGNIPTVTLRIAGVYDQDCHSIPIAQHIARIYEKRIESYFFPGDKDHGQAFVHLEDLIECIKLVADQRNELRNEIFLIAEQDVMSYEELQEQLGQLIHGEEWPTIRVPKVVAKVGAWAQEKLQGEEKTFIKPWMVDLADAHYPVVISRAREKLGWNPRHSLRNTLQEMVGRLKEHPRQWYEMNGLQPPEEQKKKTMRVPEEAPH